MTERNNMDSRYLYRQGCRTDLAKLQQLGLAAYGTFKTVLSPENWKTMETALNLNAFSDLLEISYCFVCEDKERIVGMAFLVPPGNPTPMFHTDWAYIRLLGVYPEYEGKGIGRKLTELCLGHARETDAVAIALHTSEFQHAARHIYESIGFEKAKEFLHFGKKYWVYTLNLEI